MGPARETYEMKRSSSGSNWGILVDPHALLIIQPETVSGKKTRTFGFFLFGISLMEHFTIWEKFQLTGRDVKSRQSPWHGPARSAAWLASAVPARHGTVRLARQGRGVKCPFYPSTVIKWLYGPFWQFYPRPTATIILIRSIFCLFKNLKAFKWGASHSYFSPNSLHSSNSFTPSTLSDSLKASKSLCNHIY